MIDGADLCWIHGEEPLPDTFYMLCSECGHVYVTTEDLEEAFRAEFAMQPVAADLLVSCPYCLHDF